MTSASEHHRNEFQVPPRGLLLLFLSCLSVTLWVCTSTSHVHYPAANFEAYHDMSITAVIMKDGERITFNNVGGRYIEEWNMDKVSRHVIGVSDEGRALNIDLAKALEVEALYKTSSTGGTILAILGIVVLAFVAIVVTYLALNPIHS